MKTQFKPCKTCGMDIPYGAISDMKRALKKIALMFPPEHEAAITASWALAKAEGK